MIFYLYKDLTMYWLKIFITNPSVLINQIPIIKSDLLPPDFRIIQIYSLNTIRKFNENMGIINNIDIETDDHYLNYLLYEDFKKIEYSKSDYIYELYYKSDILYRKRYSIKDKRLTININENLIYIQYTHDFKLALDYIIVNTWVCARIIFNDTYYHYKFRKDNPDKFYYLAETIFNVAVNNFSYNLTKVEKLLDD